MRYKIIFASEGDILGLQKRVNEFLETSPGWIPVGGICFGDGRMFQAVYNPNPMPIYTVDGNSYRVTITG